MSTRDHRWGWLGMSAALAAVVGVLAAALPSAGQETPEGPVPQTRAVPRLILQPQPYRTFLIRRAFVRRVSAGSTVIGRCRGPGCRIRAVRRDAFAYTDALTVPGFRGMRARPGTKIALLVSHPRQTGIVTVYKFGRGGVRAAECEVAPGSLFQDC